LCQLIYACTPEQQGVRVEKQFTLLLIPCVPEYSPHEINVRRVMLTNLGPFSEAACYAAAA
jgi:hypothetical protein